MQRYGFVPIILCLLVFGAGAQSAACPNLLPSRLVVDGQARVIVIGGSNLRTTPGSSSALLNVVPTDAVVRVVDGPFCGLSFAWWQVEYEGQRGWVAEGADGQYWLEPFAPPTGHIGRIFVQAAPEIASGFDATRLVDRTELIPQAYPIEAAIAPILRVYDVPPPDNLVRIIGAIVAANDPAQIDAPAAANPRIVRYSDGVGVRYTALDFDAQDPQPTTITYEFRGLSNNGRYVEATFPVQVPGQTTALPLAYIPPVNADEATLQAYDAQYLAQTADMLNALPVAAFTPSLSQLDALLQSLQTDAIPPDVGTILTYRDETLRIAHPDNLVAAISATAVAPDALPLHIRYDFVPAQPDERMASLPLLRMYRTANLDNNWLARLQMVLARRLANPPNLTTYETRHTPPDEIGLVRYVPFQNGQGMRFLTPHDNGFVYAFQGITADNAHYVSLVWPLSPAQPLPFSDLAPNAFAPDLDVLDAMVESVDVLLR